MGASQPLNPNTERWNESQWEILPSLSKIRTLRNIRTGSLVDEYHITEDSEKDYQFYLRSFNWRNRKFNSSPIVASIGVKGGNMGGFCRGKCTFTIYLEHVGVRLSQIEDIPLSDSLYILLTALEGYQQLYYHAGYFRVEEEQICIDRGGKVKVWVNSNLQKNYPEFDNETTCLRRDETHMVRQVIDIVESSTDPQELKSELISSYLTEIRRKQSCQIGFQRAISAVLSYAKVHNLTISNRMETAIELYHSKDCQSFASISFIEPLQQHKQEERQISPAPFLTNVKSLPSLPKYTQPRPTSVHFNYFQQQFSPNPNTRQSMFNLDKKQQKIPSDSQPPLIIEEPCSPKRASDPPQSGTRGNTSRPTTNTKTYAACLEQTTQNQSVHLPDQRGTLRGGSQLQNQSLHHQRYKNFLRYSQNIQQNYTQHHFTAIKFNRDTFGLPSHPRFMRQSLSSYRNPSSNSSRRNMGRNSRSYKTMSSQKVSEKSQIIVEKDEDQQRYFNRLNEYEEIDPEIAADMVKYLG